MRDSSNKPHFPACFVEFPPETEGRRAAFYLAAEEYIAEKLPADDYFFTWQLGPTVVFGRNQSIRQEVDLDFCSREGIDVIRRRSGGGAIFADRHNIMTSLVTEAEAVEPLFKEYAEAVASALRQLGAPVVVSGRNDTVLEGGGKICGNAFYHKKNRCIAHGTMLYDTNTRLMEGALHPEASKLKEKGVRSVRSRVGVLKDYLPFGVEELRRQLPLLLCNRTIVLTDDDVQQIEHLEKRYYEPEFLLGSTERNDAIRRGRIEGCGLVELHFRLHGSLVKEVELTGDFFVLDDAQQVFNSCFSGQPFTHESLVQAIRNHHPERSIRGLTEEGLIKILDN